MSLKILINNNNDKIKFNLAKEFNLMGSRYAESNFLVMIKQLKCSKMHFNHISCTKLQVQVIFIFLNVSLI